MNTALSVISAAMGVLSLGAVFYAIWFIRQEYSHSRAVAKANADLQLENQLAHAANKTLASTISALETENSRLKETNRAQSERIQKLLEAAIANIPAGELPASIRDGLQELSDLSTPQNPPDPDNDQ